MRNKRNVKSNLELYFNDIKDIPLLSVDEEVELAIKAQQGDKDAVDKLVTSNLRLVVKIAKGYAALYNHSMENFICEGNMGLIAAAERFLPNKNAKFSTYAAYWIKVYMERYIKKQNSREDRYEYPYIDKEDAVREYGEDALISIENINSFEDNLSDKLLIEDITSSLNEREKNILYMYYGLNGNKENTLKEISTMVDLSIEGVRKVLKKSIKKIQNSASAAAYLQEVE